MQMWLFVIKTRSIRRSEGWVRSSMCQLVDIYPYFRSLPLTSGLPLLGLRPADTSRAYVVLSDAAEATVRRHRLTALTDKQSAGTLNCSFMLAARRSA